MPQAPLRDNAVTWRVYWGNAFWVVRQFFEAVSLILVIVLALILVAAGEPEYDGTCSAAQIAVSGC